jgi:hypothetical protein
MVLLPAMLAAWVFALKGADRIDRGMRTMVAVAFGGGYFVARILNAGTILQLAAASSVLFALLCFAVLSLVRSGDGVARWLLIVVSGTALVFAGVPILEARLEKAWRQPASRIEPESAGDSGARGE